MLSSLISGTMFACGAVFVLCMMSALAFVSRCGLLGFTRRSLAALSGHFYFSRVRRVLPTRKLGITFIVLLLMEFASIWVLATQQRYFDSSPSKISTIWVRTWGGGYRDYAYGSAFVDGALYVTGDSYSDREGPVNLFVLKYDEEGELVWSRTFYLKNPVLIGDTYGIGGGTTWVSSLLGYSYTMARGIASFGDALYVCGIHTEDNSSSSILLKLDTGGNIIWSKEWSPEYNAKSTSVAVDGYGDVFVAGYVVISSSINNAFLLKYSGDGELQYSKIFYSDHTETAWSVSAGDAVYLCGETESNRSEPYALGLTLHDMFLTKVSFDGDTVWSKTYSCGYDNAANSLEAGPEISVVGFTRFDNGTARSVLLRYSLDGALDYSKVFGEATDEDVPWGVFNAGEYTYIAGQTCPFPGHPPDASLCKIGPGGGLLFWDWNWGKILDRAMSVSVSYDDVYVVGETYRSDSDSQVFVKKYFSSNVELSPEASLALRFLPYVIGVLFVAVVLYQIRRVIRPRSGVGVTDSVRCISDASGES